MRRAYLLREAIAEYLRRGELEEIEREMKGSLGCLRSGYGTAGLRG